MKIGYARVSTGDQNPELQITALKREGCEQIAGVLRYPHNLGVPLQLGKDLLAQADGDLRIDPGVLDILMAEVVRHVLNALACFQEVYGNRVAQAVDRAAFYPGLLGVLRKEGLNLAFLERSLPAGKEVVAGILADTEVGAQQLRIVAPQGFLAAH